MAFQIGDFLVDRLPLAGQVGLDFAVAGFGNDAVQPAFLGSVELGSQSFTLGIKFDMPFPGRLFEAVLFVFETGKHAIRPIIGQ